MIEVELFWGKGYQSLMAKEIWKRFLNLGKFIQMLFNVAGNINLVSVDFWYVSLKMPGLSEVAQVFLCGSDMAEGWELLDCLRLGEPGLSV